MDYSQLIRDIPDYPKKGVVFKDLTLLWKNPEAHRHSAREIASHFKEQKVSKIAATEARGFIIGSLVAAELGVGFIPIRKPGKLPYKTISESYELEYGQDKLEMHLDAIEPGDRVVLVDDLIATGGTLAAAARLIERQGGQVLGAGAIVVLDFLQPKDSLTMPVFGLVRCQ